MNINPQTDSDHFEYLHHSEKRVFQAVYERLDHINKGVDTLSTKNQNVEQGIETINNRLGKLESRASSIEAELVSIKSFLGVMKTEILESSALQKGC